MRPQKLPENYIVAIQILFYTHSNNERFRFDWCVRVGGDFAFSHGIRILLEAEKVLANLAHMLHVFWWLCRSLQFLPVQVWHLSLERLKVCESTVAAW